jgi:hypothetical protein
MNPTIKFQSTSDDRVGKFLDILMNQGIVEEFFLFQKESLGIWLYGRFYTAKCVSIFQYLEWLHIQEREKSIKIENSDIQNIEFEFA